MRLRGGYTPKKSRKSTSNRKTLRLKYKIKKRVVQHYRKARRVLAKEERDKKIKRATGKILEKPKIKFKNDLSWIMMANQEKLDSANPPPAKLAGGGSWDRGGLR